MEYWRLYRADLSLFITRVSPDVPSIKDKSFRRGDRTRRVKRATPNQVSADVTNRRPGDPSSCRRATIWGFRRNPPERSRGDLPVRFVLRNATGTYFGSSNYDIFCEPLTTCSHWYQTAPDWRRTTDETVKVTNYIARLPINIVLTRRPRLIVTIRYEHPAIERSISLAIYSLRLNSARYLGTIRARLVYMQLTIGCAFPLPGY